MFECNFLLKNLFALIVEWDFKKLYIKKWAKNLKEIFFPKQTHQKPILAILCASLSSSSVQLTPIFLFQINVFIFPCKQYSFVLGTISSTILENRNTFYNMKILLVSLVILLKFYKLRFLTVSVSLWKREGCSHILIPTLA